MGGHHANLQHGYTVVETMIFLAISGLMFVVAANFINGKQANIEFRQATQNANSIIKQVVDDVGNGNYPDLPGATCSSSSSGPIHLPALLGDTQGCVLMGKVISFNPGNSDFTIYTVAGRQYASGSITKNTPETFNQAQPVVYKSSSASFDSTEQKKFQNGLQLTKVIAGTDTNPAHGHAISGIGFFQSFGKNDSLGGLESGNQDINVYPLGTGAPGDDMGTDITNMAVGSEPVASPVIIMCFQDGGGKYATLTIGDNGQRTATHLQAANTPPVGCS